VGSFLAARLLVPRIRQPFLWFGVIEVLVGLGALVSVPLLGGMWAIDLDVLERFKWAGQWQSVLGRFVDAFTVLFVPALLMGAAFPVVMVACLRGEPPVGRRVGQVYAANTIGCVLGSFCAGFMLLPLLGAHRALLLLVAMNFAVGVAFVWYAGARSVATRYGIALPLAAACVLAFVLTPSDVFHRTIGTFHYPARITFIKEHPTGTVTVHELPNKDRLLAVDGVNVAGVDFMLRSTQKLQGYIPLALHPDPQRVVQIGFGSGETARVGVEFGVDDWTVVEICPAVFEAGAQFEDINNGSFRDPRIRKIAMDGKNFALLSGETFDIVMNDSIFPGSSGSSALYTVDHFRNCRERLAEGGLFSCWVPLDLRPHELRMILRSFQEVFPHTSFWVASNCLNKQSLILGSVEPFRFDFARVKEVLARPNVAADLREVAIHDVYEFFECFVCDEKTIRDWVAGDPVNTDNRPRLSYSCAIPKHWEVALAQVLSEMLKHHASVEPYLVNVVDEPRARAEIARHVEAAKSIFLAHVAQLRRMPTERRQLFELALKANPGEVHVESCQEELRKEIEDLRAALRIVPDNPTLSLRLADKISIAGQEPFKELNATMYREAARLYQRVIAALPNPPAGAYLGLGEARFRLNEPAEAEQVLRQCLARYPDSAPAHDLLAGICLRTGRYELARSHIEEALRLVPGNALYLVHQKQILQAHDRPR
jgi:spermidine synthase